MADRWDQIQDLYHRALARSEGERNRFLVEACGGDEPLRQEVESLLKHHSEAQQALSIPAIAMAAKIARRMESGQQIGSYKVLSLLGTGGMGDVYRARDAKLKRDVAIKVLPEEFSSDSERVRRFQREAEVLASLNHPNIAAIYELEGFESSQYLVLELVEGETLAALTARGPIPIAEALAIARQIADSLEAAHEKGIIHRDLKPANVAITPDGTVKLLDFGLAKTSTGVNEDLSQTPTAAGTEGGLIIGTAAYMSPEQARGKTVDKRTDIWAFGCVLYEMLSGKRAFAGETISDLIVATLEREPDWTALPALASPSIRRLLLRCLEKDPKRRLRDIGDARMELETAGGLANPAEEQVQTAASRTIIVNRALAAIAAVAVVAFAVIIFRWAPWRTSPPAAPMRLNSELGADARLAVVSLNSALALSPDGSTLAFVGAKNGLQIYIRRLGQLQAFPLAGTSGALSPFFSPNGQWLGFFAGGKLKKISVTGGAAVTLADAVKPHGGSWGDDGYIVFAYDNVTGLQRVPSAGGKVEPLTKLAQGEATQKWPQMLPGAKAVLYFSNAATGPGTIYEDSNIVVQPLPSGTPKVLVRGGYHPQYVASGHLVYIHEGTLFAAPFDLNRLEVTGQAVPVVENISATGGSGGDGSAQFAVSQAGAFTYLPEPNAELLSPIVWLTHDGNATPLRAKPSDWRSPHLSPDGQRLAMEIANNGNIDVWIYEWARDALTRLTSDPLDRTPVWTPDGTRIVFASGRAGRNVNLYWQRADGTGEVQRLTESSNAQFPSSFHPSGKY